jgi:hypothetical protein
MMDTAMDSFTSFYSNKGLSSDQSMLSFTLEIVLLLASLCLIATSAFRITLDSGESTKDKIVNYISPSVYISVFISTPKIVDKLLSVPKDVLIGIGGGLLLFAVIERVVEAVSCAIASILSPPTDFAIQQIAKVLPKKKESHRQEEFLFEDDIRIAAVHEAGHALMFWVLKTIPPSLFAHINKRALCRTEPFSVGGQVSVNAKPHGLHYQSFLEWEMLLSLAGMEAEKALLGDRSSGGRGDMEHWHTKARLYLASGCSTLVYFSNPCKGWEIQTNQESLESLLSKQRNILEQFFDLNRTVLSELSEALIQQERMKAPALQPFLEKIVSVNGIPKIEDKYLRFQ